MSHATSVDAASPVAPTRTRKAAILGVGGYLPPDVITNLDLEALVETSDSWIMDRTGIRTRHRAGSGETSAALGLKAALPALAMAGSPTLDAIIFATCSPDTLLPSSACLMQRELGVGGAAAFDINAACSGWVYGLQLASSMVQSGAANTVLVVCAEALTRLVDYGDRSTCVLFGDGAGATVVGLAGDGPAVLATRWGADGGQAEIIYYGPKQEAEASPDGLRMAGRGTFRLAVERLCAMAEELAADCGWTLDEVDHFIPHQANQRIIEAAAKRSGIPLSKIVLNVAETGNTSAASIPLAMADAAREGRLKRGDKVVCVAFGAGSTWGGVALEWAL